MAADVLIRPTEPGDVAVLYANLREPDLTECMAYGAADIETEIAASVRRSALCWTGLINGEIACIMGVGTVDMLAGVGSPWMLGTPVLDANARVLVRETPAYIARMLIAFPILQNFVHQKNSTSVRWLRRLGFTLHAPAPFGPLGEPFHRFEMRA